MRNIFLASRSFLQISVIPGKWLILCNKRMYIRTYVYTTRNVSGDDLTVQHSYVCAWSTHEVCNSSVKWEFRAKLKVCSIMHILCTYVLWMFTTANAIATHSTYTLCTNQMHYVTNSIHQKVHSSITILAHTWYGLSSAARSMETEQSDQYKTASLPSSTTRKPNFLHALRTASTTHPKSIH